MASRELLLRARGQGSAAWLGEPAVGRVQVEPAAGDEKDAVIVAH